MALEVDRRTQFVPSSLRKKRNEGRIYKGTELSDPAGLLTGAGKAHKHVVITAEDDLKKVALEKLLLDAVEAYHKRKGPGI